MGAVGMELGSPSLVARASSWAELLLPPSVDALYIHPALRVGDLAGKGRGYLATASIRPGTILIRERAFASSPVPLDGLCTRCARLFTSPATTCHRCTAQFCSHECRAEEERRRHWLDCSATPLPINVRLALSTPTHLRHLFHDPPTIHLDAQLQVVIHFHPVTKRALQETLENEEAYVSLLGSLPMHMSFAEAANILAAVPLEGLKGKEEKRMRRFLTTIFAIISSGNAFSLEVVTEGEESGFRFPSRDKPPRGTGIFPAAALFNHACIPNAFHTMERGDVIYVRAVKDIAIGEEIVISYATNVTPLRHGTPARQDKLKSWRFTCACSQACGNKEWLKKEAKYWGFSCLGDCAGPANFEPRPILYDDRALISHIITKYESDNPDVLKFGRLSCRQCGLRRELTQTESLNYLRLILLTTTSARIKVTLGEFRRLASNLYPISRHRIIAEMFVSECRCRKCYRAYPNYLDQRCLDDLERFLEGRLEVGGAEQLRTGVGQLFVACLIFSFPERCPKAETRARQLHKAAIAVFANHFGAASPFATQTLPL